MIEIPRCVRSLNKESIGPALILGVTTLAGCFGAKRDTAIASRAALPSNAPRLETPALPSAMYSYAASADSAVTRLSVRGPGGPPGGPDGPPPGGPGPGRGGPGGRGGRGGGGLNGDGALGGPGRGGGRGRGGFGPAFDNTPVANPVTDAGATLGRVLFYDRHLSVNNQIACASCHVQRFGFADSARLSRGFAGGVTRRHSMALANARFYANGRFFWDERAGTLEAQVLMPVQDPVEMGMNLLALETKLRDVAYYKPLFQSAFGTPDVTSDRIARALAQFVRSMVSADARFDRVAFGSLTDQEREGLRLFNGQAGCGRCHAGRALASDGARNTGLDAVVTDSGAGRGRFKVPSLRNVAVRAPYMHDGRFKTLEEVVDHYNGGVKDNPALDPRLRARGGVPRSLGLTSGEKKAVVAYLRTLTDSSFLTAPRFSDPFVIQPAYTRRAH